MQCFKKWKHAHDADATTLAGAPSLFLAHRRVKIHENLAYSAAQAKKCIKRSSSFILSNTDAALAASICECPRYDFYDHRVLVSVLKAAKSTPNKICWDLGTPGAMDHLLGAVVGFCRCCYHAIFQCLEVGFVMSLTPSHPLNTEDCEYVPALRSLTYSHRSHLFFYTFELRVAACRVQ